MYIPKHFEQTDRTLLLEVMHKHNFGLLIGTDPDGLPFVTHLPYVVKQDGDRLWLEAHMAKGNPHWRYLEQNTNAMALFSGPHAYVSPSLYESKQAVPTWNYVTVHAYGKVKVLQEATSIRASHRALIQSTDPDYLRQYEELESSFLDSMTNGVVALEFTVERLEGKFKLNQNRPPLDRQTVAAALGQGNDDARGVADWMRRLVL